MLLRLISESCSFNDDILEYINRVFKTNYTNVEIVDRLEECHNF